MNRSGTKFKSLAEDLNTLVLLQNRYKNIVAQLFDECYMFCRTQNGHIAHRCGKVFDEGKQQNEFVLVNS